MVSCMRVHCLPIHHPNLHTHTFHLVIGHTTWRKLWGAESSSMDRIHGDTGLIPHHILTESISRVWLMDCFCNHDTTLPLIRTSLSPSQLHNLYKLFNETGRVSCWQHTFYIKNREREREGDQQMKKRKRAVWREGGGEQWRVARLSEWSRN